jgi:hypothetical protein
MAIRQGDGMVKVERKEPQMKTILLATDGRRARPLRSSPPTASVPALMRGRRGGAMLPP